MKAVKENVYLDDLNHKKISRKNIQIYVSEPSKDVFKIGSPDLRLFLLRGMINFVKNEINFINLVVKQKLFDIKQFDGNNTVKLVNGTSKIIDVIPVVTSKSFTRIQGCNVVISAISSQKFIKHIQGFNVVVKSLLYFNEDELLMYLKQQDNDLRESITYIYNLLNKHRDIFKYIVKKDEIKYFENIEKYLDDRYDYA